MLRVGREVGEERELAEHGRSFPGPSHHPSCLDQREIGAMQAVKSKIPLGMHLVSRAWASAACGGVTASGLPVLLDALREEEGKTRERGILTRMSLAWMPGPGRCAARSWRERELISRGDGPVSNHISVWVSVRMLKLDGCLLTSLPLGLGDASAAMIPW